MKKKRYRWISVLTAIGILIIWYLITEYGSMSELIFPSPKNVFKSFIEIMQEGYKGHTLWQHLFDSLKRILSAYFLAIVIFVPLGLLSGYYTPINAVFEPIMSFFRPLPPLAYYSVLVLWLGIGDGSKVALLFLAAAAPLYISCVSGISRIKEDYINGARTLGANERQIFFHVMFYAALPDIFTGLRNSMGSAYSTLVAAEMVAAVSGIGWLALDASKYLRSDIIFVGIIFMGITGIILDEILKFIEKKVVFWKGKS
ncbi:MAG: ABC transporter permease [Lachnospiraceae bacterium]|nr:ABC transporter permease [Lachnospiraceae bacterium]